MPVKHHKRSVLLWRIPLGRWRWPRRRRRGGWTAPSIGQSVLPRRKRKSFTRVPGVASTAAFVLLLPCAVSECEQLLCWQGVHGGQQQLSPGSVPRDSGGGRAVCTWENLLLTGAANRALSVHALRLAFLERDETLLLLLSLAKKKSFVPRLILIFFSFLFRPYNFAALCLKKIIRNRLGLNFWSA